MTIQYYPEIIQGTQEWLQLRQGCITASEMKRILSPVRLKYAAGDEESNYLYEIMAQRITKYTEPVFINDDMLRGQEDEIYARIEYSAELAEVETLGFITNDKLGFIIGYSPDGLVGEDGLIEIKSRRQKLHIGTILKNAVPTEFMLQVQTGLWVSERQWCDYISYCGGLPMAIIRVYPDERIFRAIEQAASVFEERVQKSIAQYYQIIEAKPSETRFIPTERRIEQEITI